MIVANRYAELGIFELPRQWPASGDVALDPVRIMGNDRRDLVKYPGSVSVFPIGLGLVEILLMSRWWRVTTPLRRLTASLQYAAVRARHRVKRAVAR